MIELFDLEALTIPDAREISGMTTSSGEWVGIDPMTKMQEIFIAWGLA